MSTSSTDRGAEKGFTDGNNSCLNKLKNCYDRAGANCVSDDDMYNAIMAGHEANQKIISFIEEIKAEIGKPKFEFASLEPDHDMFEAIKAFAEEDVKVALDTDDKRIVTKDSSLSMRQFTQI